MRLEVRRLESSLDRKEVQLMELQVMNRWLTDCPPPHAILDAFDRVSPFSAPLTPPRLVCVCMCVCGACRLPMMMCWSGSRARAASCWQHLEAAQAQPAQPMRQHSAR